MQVVELLYSLSLDLRFQSCFSASFTLQLHRERRGPRSAFSEIAKEEQVVSPKVRLFPKANPKPLWIKNLAFETNPHSLIVQAKAWASELGLD